MQHSVIPLDQYITLYLHGTNSNLPILCVHLASYNYAIWPTKMTGSLLALFIKLVAKILLGNIVHHVRVFIHIVTKTLI